MNKISNFIKPLKNFRTIFILLFVLLSSFRMLAQPANDDCANASYMVPGTCCTFYYNTTIGATASTGVANPSCGGYAGGDVWFQVVVPASGALIIQTQTINSASDASMAIYSGACGALTEIACSADNGSDIDPMISSNTLIPGSTVFIRYWMANGAAGADFNICVYSPPVELPCTNLGFEDSGTGWIATLGNSVTGPAGAPTPTYIPSVFCAAVGSDNNLMLFSSGNDPYGGFPCVYNGVYSLRVGDPATSTNNEPYNAASIQQTFMVDPSNTKLSIHFAAVLQDGGHNDNIQPFFTMELLDQTGAEIECAHYIVTVPYTGFVLAPTGTNVYYRPWTEVNMNLTNYVGQSLTVKFTTSDCEHSNNGAHFGYVYLDCACAPYDIIAPDTVCLGQTATLYAPLGADTYLWSTGETGTSINITPTQDSTFYVTITETAITTCSSVLEAHVFVRPYIPPTCSSNSPICEGTTLNLFSTPPSAAAYSWVGPNSFTSTDQNPTIPNATPAATGTYTVTVQKNGCTGTISVDVVVNPLAVVIPSTNTPICAGGNINLTCSPDDALTYHWTGPGSFSSSIQSPTIANATPAASGNYTITVSYPGGCTSSASTYATVNTSVLLNASMTANVSCYGLADGTATAIPSNGTSPYTYHWNTLPPQNTQNAINLAPGTYYVTVTDFASCTNLDSVVITQPTALNAMITSVHDAICYNATTGWATAIASGATSPYTYSWSGGTGSGGTVTGLGFGNYTVTVSDIHTCDTVLSFSIGNGPQLFLSFSDTNETCPTYCDGGIAALVSGGTSPYVYHWSNSATTSSISNLCAGSYSLTVTDSNNCPINNQTSIITTTIVNAVASVDSINSVIGQPVNFYGSGGMGYTWNFGDGSATSTAQDPSHTYTTDGTYSITLTVSSGPPNNCLDVTTIVITIFIPSSIIIPNIITPNGDGFNDEFRVKSIGLGKEEMMIYNRWGKKVYSWSQVNGFWDGKDGNKEYSDGVYFYIYSADGAGDGKHYDMHGTVTVLK